MRYTIAMILFAVTCQAEQLYLEVNDELARISVSNVTEAVEILPEVIAEIEATNYTATVHAHNHEEDPNMNKPCEVTPLANGDEDDVVIVETELTEAQSRTQLPEFLAMKYDGTDKDANKKANKLKATRFLKDKPTKEKKEKRKKN